MTKQKFLEAYRNYCVATYAWAADVPKLASFMTSVEQTLTTERTSWVWDGTGSKAAWKAMGAKGPMTLKALRALPAI